MANTWNTSEMVLAIDQSTQGTKAILVDRNGKILGRHDEKHRQYISEQGWVSHDLDEIYENVIKACRAVIEETGVDPAQIVCLGISNQRETTAAWNRKTGKPYEKAIVWQCSRAEKICKRVAETPGAEELIYQSTGITLNPYYPASKMAWFLEHVPELKRDIQNMTGEAALGTIDSWLVNRLTEGASFRIDYSNASRTQLFNLETLAWDEQVCGLFGIPLETLPEVTDSDACFGKTDLMGILPDKIPITGVVGDSHAALFGHNCRQAGGIKATYGTGSSIALNTGRKKVMSRSGLSTSIGWKAGGEVHYILEGNINYTGAVFTWLKDDLGLIDSVAQIEPMAREANEQDKTYIVPAFSGLGTPYWMDDVRAAIVGMSRASGRNEIVRAGCRSIAFQINDVIEAMRGDTGLEIGTLDVDGGPTRNGYLMQFQSDISHVTVRVPDTEEFSALGAAYMAGLSTGIYTEQVFEAVSTQPYVSQMEAESRQNELAGWKKAVEAAMTARSSG